MPQRDQETRGHFILTIGKRRGVRDTLSSFIKVICSQTRSVTCVAEWVINYEKAINPSCIGLDSSTKTACLRLREMETEKEKKRSNSVHEVRYSPGEAGEGSLILEPA